jgi:hypothetical protein
MSSLNMCFSTATGLHARDFRGNSVFYYFSDHLKTVALETDSQGTIKDESDFYPWGGELHFTDSNDTGPSVLS